MLDMLWLGMNPSSFGISSATSSQMQSNATRTGQGLSPLPSTPTPSSSAQMGIPAASKGPTSVPIDRAVWFIRTVGASDLANRSRGAASLTPANFTAEFTNIYTGWMRKQLAELTEANVHEATATLDVGLAELGHSHAYTDFNVRWSTKWRYSQLLLDTLFEENLIDVRVWSGFVTQAFSTASIVQLPLTIAMLQDSLRSIACNDGLSRAAVAGLCSHVQELQAPKYGTLTGAQVLSELKEMILQMWAENADAFRSTLLWTKYGGSLQEILQPTAQAHELIAAQDRTQACLAGERSEASRCHSSWRRRLLINRLDQFNESSDVSILQELVAEAYSAIGMSRVVIMLAKWACTSVRYSHGHWRPILASRLIRGPRRGCVGKPRASKAHDEELEGYIIAWLDEVGPHEDPKIDFNLLVTFLTELSHAGLFSYAKFLHRLSTKGISARNAASGGGFAGTDSANRGAADGLHFRLLRSLPVDDLSTSLRHQRRMAIYGARTTESREEATHRRALRELKRFFPFVGSALEEAPQSSIQYTQQGVVKALPHLWQASRFVSHRLLTKQLLPPVLSWIDVTHEFQTDAGVALLFVYREGKEWHGIAKILNQLLIRVSTIQQERLASGSSVDVLEVEILRVARAAAIINVKELDALDYLAAIEGNLRSVAAVMLSSHAHRKDDMCRTISSEVTASQVSAQASQAALAAIDRVKVLDWQPSDNTGTLYWLKCENLWTQNPDPSVRNCLETCSVYLSCIVQSTESEAQSWCKIGRRDACALGRLCRRAGPNAARSCCKLMMDKVGKTQAGVLSVDQTKRCAGFLTGLLLDGAVPGDAFFESLYALLVSPLAGAAQSTSDHVSVGARLAEQVLASLTCLADNQGESELSVTDQLYALAAMNEADAGVLVNICASLAVSLASSKSPRDHIERVLEHLISLARVRDYVTESPSRLGDAARRALKGAWINPHDALQLLYGHLSSAENPSLLSSPASNFDLDEALRRLDDFGSSATVEELGFIFAGLSAVEASQQSRADAKIAKAAVGLLPQVFIGAEAHLPDGLRLWDLSGRDFRSATCEGLWRALVASKSAQVSLPPDATMETSIMEALSSILARCEATTFPPCNSEPLQELFQFIKRFFEHADETEEPLGVEQISAHCRLLRLLLFCPSLWCASVRSCIAEFDVSMMRCLTRYTLDVDDEEAACFTVLRDTVSLLHEQTPQDLQQTCSTQLSHYFSDLPGHFPLPMASFNRIASFNRLLPFAPTTRTGAETLIMAPSLKDAYERGDYTPVVNNPWKWGDAVEPGANAKAGEGGANRNQKPIANAAPQPTSTALWGPLTIPPLTNSLAVSLDWFGPRRINAFAPDPQQDWLASEQQDRLDSHETDQAWRMIPSERQMVLDRSIEGFAESVRSGSRYVAPRLDGMLREGEEDGDDSNKAASLASLVGLPTGPVQTMAAYLEGEKRKRAEAAAASKAATAAGDTKKRKGSTMNSRKRTESADSGDVVAPVTGRGRKRTGSNASRASSTASTSKKGRKA